MYSAFIASPRTSPVSASIPVGISTATVFLECLLIKSITFFINPRGAPSAPVPRRASITMSALASSFSNDSTKAGEVISLIGIPIFSVMTRLVAASPLMFFFSARRNIFAFTFWLKRCLATTIPSPPLLPEPAKIYTYFPFRGPYFLSIASATFKPAFSIRTILGIPISSMAFLSMRRISSLVTNFISLLFHYNATAWAIA